MLNIDLESKVLDVLCKHSCGYMMLYEDYEDCDKELKELSNKITTELINTPVSYTYKIKVNCGIEVNHKFRVIQSNENEVKYEQPYKAQDKFNCFKI